MRSTSGNTKRSEWPPCPVCSGTGYLDDEYGVAETCSGHTRPCTLCGGTGYTEPRADTAYTGTSRKEGGER